MIAQLPPSAPGLPFGVSAQLALGVALIVFALVLLTVLAFARGSAADFTRLALLLAGLFGGILICGDRFGGPGLFVSIVLSCIAFFLVIVATE